MGGSRSSKVPDFPPPPPPPDKYETRTAARTDKRSILKILFKIGDYDRSKLWKYLDTGIAVKIAVHRVVVGCAYMVSTCYPTVLLSS